MIESKYYTEKSYLFPLLCIKVNQLHWYDAGYNKTKNHIFGNNSPLVYHVRVGRGKVYIRYVSLPCDKIYDTVLIALIVKVSQGLIRDAIYTSM